MKGLSRELNKTDDVRQNMPKDQSVVFPDLFLETKHRTESKHLNKKKTITAKNSISAQ